MKIFSLFFRQVPKCLPPPKPAASSELLEEVFNLLKQSQKPLVVIGKGIYDIFIYVSLT